jgi:hypothetical protein
MKLISIDEFVKKIEREASIPKRRASPDSGDDDRPLGDPPAMALPRAA